jgi:hypothetical protein
VLSFAPSIATLEVQKQGAVLGAHFARRDDFRVWISPNVFMSDDVQEMDAIAI